MTACNVSPCCFWQKTKEKWNKERGLNLGKLFFNSSSEKNCLCRDQFFLSFLILLKRVFLCIFALSWLLKQRLFDWICHCRHSVMLMDPLDAGPRLAGSIFFRCSFFLSLWHYKKRSTLYSRLNGEWCYLTYCTATVYKNANDNHKKGHLDYCQASQSCLFPSGLLSFYSFTICLLFILIQKAGQRVYYAHIRVWMEKWHFCVKSWARGASSIFDYTESDPWVVSCNQSACL